MNLTFAGLIAHPNKTRETMKRTLFVLLPLCAMLLIGCGAFSVSVSEIENPGQQVSAKTSKFSFFWLSPLSLDDTTRLVGQLSEQCGDAGVTAITTRASAAWAIIGQVETIELVGHCKET